ncbi:lamin tail domain-containing protein [Bacillus sp. Y1]|nr:lamin tail domain-containing protein [Bacillus sp. Y1]
MRRKQRNSFQKYYSIVLSISLLLTSVVTSIPFNTFAAAEITGSTSEGTLVENEALTSTEETTPTTPEDSFPTDLETTVAETPQQEIDSITEVETNSTTEATEEDHQSYPSILITEISPNSKGTGTDYFEFIEIYNNSNQPLPLKNYSFVYQYTDGSREDLPFEVPAVTVEPQKTIVLWFNNGGKTFENFNSNFETSLPKEAVIEFTDVFPGFANGGNRAITVRNQEGKDLVTASYLGSENDNNGNGIAYKYPVSGILMDKYNMLAAPTPGSIESQQVPTQPVEIPENPTDTQPPSIQHEPVKAASEFLSIKISAEITDNLAVPNATLFYKNETMNAFSSISMIKDGQSNIFTAAIPEVDVSSHITYYMEASDGINNVKTEQYRVEVKTTSVDYTTLPPFLVTEVLSDSTNVGSADGYEFIEIYNNSNSPVSLKDYKLNYRYYTNDPGSDVVWASVPDDVNIPANETLVFWIINDQNGSKTVADFNQHFGTNLVENEDIVRIFSSGMANGSLRGLVMATNTGKEIAVAYYNEESNVDDTYADKGIQYRYPTDKSKKMYKLTIEPATPGSVRPIQVPVTAREYPVDSTSPVLENLTDVTTANQTENIEVIAKATDDREVKTVKIFYKISGQTEFTEAIVKENYDDSFFHHTIYSPEIIGKEYVDYYLFASDGINDETSETYRVQITNDLDQSSLRLNIKKGDIVGGEKALKATSASDRPENVKLSIDETEVTTDLYSSLEHTAYLAFEANGLNTYFQNAVTMGEEILYLMDKDWLSAWKTFSVPITSDRLQVGDNIITLRSGNKASPFDLESAENRDDYDLRNVRLVLADGTVIMDPNFNDPTIIKMNDGNPFVDFHFSITEEHARSKTFSWNTTTVPDGEHTITIADLDEEVSATVIVDNTAPIISTNIKEGKTYKGAFEIQAKAKDAGAGVELVEAFLDDEPIQIPYDTASSKLMPGEHKLSITAKDSIGNSSTMIVHFSVVNENPAQPMDVSSFGETLVEGDPVLKVKVTDPTNDKMDVSFYEGFQYDVGDKLQVKGYANVADVEPPNEPAPQGEGTFSEDDISLVAKQDGKYLTKDSSEGFPYHRFDVTVDEKVDANDLLELFWTGNSLPGRKVSMYAWSHATNKWELIDYKIAGESDFTLKGNVKVDGYVHEQKINVLVQDEIPSNPSDYDYTFVWMSDTQYYSESFPYIYEQQTKWIAEHQDDMKIKYVFHTGDLVNISTDMTQWSRANEYMKIFDDHNVPYGVLAGNHDVDQVSTDYSNYYQFFGENRFNHKPYYGGSYLNNRGHYDLISVGGNDYIMVYLGWGVTDEGIQWINDVLKAHPDRKAILNFHEYLLATGTRHPLGEKLYHEIVVPNKNVMAVLSGHYHEAQTLIDEIDDNGDGTPDRKVYQMLADYQAGPEGGQGYMRLLHFDVDQNRVFVNTYSPYLDDYNFYNTDTFGNKDEFVMDLDLAAADKQVATDYFSVNIYTDTLIGEDRKVKSGGIAETTWKGLEENQTYSWYAVVSDRYTGNTISPIWIFVKGKSISNGGKSTGKGNGKPLK